jgi:muconate cycloisomerase
MSAVPQKLEIYRTALPMRRFEHAAAQRDLAEAVVVRLECSDGRSGWGETLPRPYVTGESIQSVISDLQEILWPRLAGRQIDWDNTYEFIPRVAPGGRCLNAAACALDVAVLPWFLEFVHKQGLAPVRQDARGRPTRQIAPRVSGVLGSSDPGRTARQLRLMRWYGLRHFKLKLGLGDDIDQENLRLVHKAIGKGIAADRYSLRVDVNGAWKADEAPQRIDQLKGLGVSLVEQPVYCSAGEFTQLARKCRLPLMADESLLTYEDAKTLADAPEWTWWNIRISKNGGFIPAWLLGAMAREKGVPFVLGCMVGESSILSAAQRRLLESGYAPRYVEGNYGRFLLGDDLTKHSLRFGYGGRLRPLEGEGLGVEVDPAKLARYAQRVASL